ncbi:fibrocystin-L-like isoform X2 [Mya arenaria]|nr:fibrocystin-L-like isoform X2 [Mya arenaria]
MQIMCYTPSGMQEENYYVKVVVDGQAVPDGALCGGNPTSSSCTYKPRPNETPTISELSPQSGMPGTFVNMKGKLFSDRYGSNLASATNGREERLLRVYVGPQDCGLREKDAFFGLALNDEGTDYGTLTCKHKGTSVGFYNASFIVEAPYGRSLPDSDVYRVAYNDQIYMYQSYSELTSISHTSGSTAGGLLLTIYGSYIDENDPYSKLRAYVDDTVCEITNVVVDEYVECIIAAEPDSHGPSYHGNRGVIYEYWNETSKGSGDLDSILDMTSSDPNYVSDWLDETSYYDSDSMDNYASRMTTYFTPPHNGEYSFGLNADDGARLFVDGVAMVTSTRSMQWSPRMNLTAGNRYLLQVTHYENGGDSFIYLQAYHFDTKFSTQWTGRAVQEEQTLEILSDITYDVQRLDFFEFTSKTASQEEQTVKINNAEQFRLGLYGVYTEQLDIGMDDTLVTAAMNALPILVSGESILVTRQETGTPTYKVTFQSNRGDFPDLSVMGPNGTEIDYDVSEDTKGRPDVDTVALTLEGTVSQPFSVSSVSQSQLNTIVNGMFEAQCPEVFEGKGKAKIYENFEASSGLWSGYRVKDSEPFCGRYALKYPNRIYQAAEEDFGIMLAQHGVLCFAYKGFLKSFIGVKITVTQASDGETAEKTIYFSYEFKTDSSTESNTWYYTCYDIYDGVMDRYPADTMHILRQVFVSSVNSVKPGYVDAVFIGTENTLEDSEAYLRRSPPAMPNRAIINEVTVAAVTETQYDVTIKPYECGNEFPLFAVANAGVTSGSVTYPSDSVTLKLSNSGGSGVVKVTRSSHASPPVTGEVDITFNGESRTGLNISLEDYQFKRELESLNGIGSLSVKKVGTCAAFDLEVTFLTLPGDLPEMTVTYGNLEGVKARGSIRTDIDGGLYYGPLTGDMVSTVHDSPQVRLYVNDVPTFCAGDCSFTWETADTPTVTGVNPTLGTLAQGTSIVISGTGFSSTEGNNRVIIGDVECSVTAATSTSITCDVGNGPVGVHVVLVNVLGSGLSTGTVEFTYIADITSISPTSASLGGGITLTISGYGFSSAPGVTVNSAPCPLLSSAPGEITCILPGSMSAGSFDVVVSQDDETLTSSFSYDLTLTPEVTSITPDTFTGLSVTLTIAGSKFGINPGTVYLGDNEATVTSWADNVVEVELEITKAGDLDVKVMTTDGLAVDSSYEIPSVTSGLKVTNMFPSQGSRQGGSILTITGVGFGTNESLVDVNFGDIDCEVDTVTDTQIVCETSTATKTHIVTNKGTDPAFGVFYAFDRPYLIVQEGDFVHWFWETPEFVNNIAHDVFEVDSPSSNEPKVGGFSSGNPSRNGDFKYQFPSAGIYYVSSGFVDEYGIKIYGGTIAVMPASGKFRELSVSLAGVEALHEVGGAADPDDSSVCNSVTSPKAGCFPFPSIGLDSSKFNFAFDPCSTPIVNEVSVNNGTVQTEITISGEGFSSTSCQNDVIFGGYACDVTYSTSSQIKCTLSKDREPELAVFHQIDLKVSNRGKSLTTIMSEVERGFALLPNIEGISPSSGSQAGGAQITITGSGFTSEPYVDIGGYSCEVLEFSYSEVVCRTPASSLQTQKELTVEVNVNGVFIPAKCETSDKVCVYSYARLWTPTADSISPISMSTTTTFTITGTKFGTNIGGIEVLIGGETASVDTATDTSITATISNIPAGSNDVIVRVGSNGQAEGSLAVTGDPVINSITPTAGSIHGQTEITIAGNGFVDGDTNVTINGSPCLIASVTLSEVVCITPNGGAAGSESVDITSNGESFPSSTFEYATASTPTVTAIDPVSGLGGETLTITGTNLAGDNVYVTLGDAECTVASSTSTEIICTAGDHQTGDVPVSVFVENLGASNTDVMFEYQLSLDSILPTTGGIAGGQFLVLSGTGFTEDAVVTLCGQECQHVSSNTSQYTCRTPANSAQICDVSIAVNGLSKTLSNEYTYDASLTPSVSGVTPRRGGTGGGTTITITGSGFGTTQGDISVIIDGAECEVTAVVDNAIECDTGSHSGSVDASVEVQVSGNGIAQETASGDADFSYIDVWSSTFTWGGGPLPEAGDMVVVPTGMTLLLDMDTPILAFLLIQGGKLIFDDKDVELQSKIIMITDGGLLQVGTVDEPFQDKAIITLHGHHRDKELPIYGTKVLAVRNGSLELHGIGVPLTWTRLESTSNAGDNTLTLVDPVEWSIGDEIVIASTGHRHTQSENEKKTIQSISSDKRTLTLNEPLEAVHVGTEETFDGTLVEFRAEVGLLTHNVVVRGNTDPQWEDVIDACEQGFDTGEFATQTCFLGRFGDEIGSSQFGGMVLVHAPVKDTHEAEARFSYVEFTFVGQAFRLGRYPVHFHLNGDMSSSYVRGCSIHKSFNRAVNIHGTHNTMVERTVIFDIMGGAFFLEDGIETGNTFQYNLAVFVRESSSLLNDDVTPAAFWVTNPNNTIQHNAAAGGSHFGFWYRMHSRPDGPSFTNDVCPKQVPLGVFYNNSAHSFGWFGLWTFPDFFPAQGGCGGSVVEPAVFDGLFSWNNEKGAETVNGGALQLKNCILVQNKIAGYEGKTISNVPLYTDDSPMVIDSLIVGKTTVIPSSEQGCTSGGIVFPYGRGFKVVNVRFVNFADDCSAFTWTRITGTCSFLCGGFTYHTEGLTFINAQNKVNYAWESQGVILDLDGSATGKPANWTVLPSSGTLPDDCEPAPEFSIGVPASMCPPQHKWHRFAFNKPKPASLEGKNFGFENQYGNSSVMYAQKRLTHKPGWMCALLGGASYKFYFVDAEQIRNISFVGQFYDFEASDYIVVRLPVETLPDRLSLDGGQSFINMTEGLDPATAKHGDWEWDNINDEIDFVISGTQRSRRGLSTIAMDRPLSFTAYKCFYTDCIPPPDPDTVPPAVSRPPEFGYWDDATIWNMTEDGYLINIGGSSGIPQDYDNVKISFGTWMVVNMTSISKLGTLLLEGVLEFYNDPGAVYSIEADFIIIRGGRLIIGWPDEPFNGLATITLRGNHSSPYFIAGDGPTIGSKAIGVFGGLDLFGKDKGRTWTQLASTADAGSDTIVLAEPVEWEVGDDIVIAPTSYNAWESEGVRITAIAGDNMTLTLNDTLKYRHVAHNEMLNSGYTIDVGAGVGLLSHNIKVIGEDYGDLYDESFGARVLVGLIVYNGQAYTGYARLANVEFYHTGQEGWTEEYDPRFSVAYVATGSVSNVKPSKISKCSFHNGFNTAVGAFGIGGLEISENVVYGSVGNGMATSSDGTQLLHNFINLMISTASYQDRMEIFNIRWEAGIEAFEADGLVLQGNLVSGSERLAYHVPPLPCTDNSGRYSNNMAYANLLGVVTLPGDNLGGQGCVKYANFTVWKSHDFGIFYQNSPDFVAENNVFVENQNGLFPIVLGPGSSGHGFANRRMAVNDNIFVGQTTSYDCSLDTKPSGDDNFEISAKSRPSLAYGGGMVGLIFPQFYSGGNNAPIKPFKGIMAYNANGGLMTASANTFAKYGNLGCDDIGNFAVSTNIGNDDGQHPIEMTLTTLVDVEHSNKIMYHRPNVGKINSADCVDMDCDALKKALFKDMDGSFLGHVGSVIPQSEYEWDGDPRRGLGDYRIPKEMVTRLDGSRIPYELMMPNKGVIRNENCTYQSNWQAYECLDDIDHELLLIESMDADTETRRISPVAVLGTGYIDLINGPQDHGWCSGYTCRKRLSTFMALVATDKEFLIHFTGTTPEKMRYRLLNVDPEEGVKLTVWYSRPNRLDVFVDGVYKIATNARIDSNGRYITSMPTGNEFEPMIANGTGTNYFHRDRGELTFIVQGQQRIDVISRDTIIVSFSLPALTVDEFFGDNIIENVAAFLNIPLTKVRIMNVVSESETRKKRDSGGVTVELEIGDEPVASENDTASDNIDLNQLYNFASEIVNECQAGNISASFNVSGSCESVSVPSADPEEGTIVYGTPSPTYLYFHTELSPEYETMPLTVQPKVRAADISDLVVVELGTRENPWELTVSIRQGTGHPDAVLDGTLNITSADGWFNFTDLVISHMGNDYVLDFNVTYPPEAENFTLSSDPFDLSGRPVAINIASMTSGDIVQNEQLAITLELIDEMTGDVISDISWRDHAWSANVSLLGNSLHGDLQGTTTATFDPITGLASFRDLNITGFGMFYMKFHVTTDPAGFDLTHYHKLVVVNPDHIGLFVDESYDMEVKFDVDFYTVLSTEALQYEFEAFIITEYANTWSDVKFTVGSIAEGSIVVTFTIQGNASHVSETAFDLCDSIFNKTEYGFNGYQLTLAPYMSVNGSTYYGVKCGELSDDEDDGFAAWKIAVIVVCCVLAVIGIAVLVVFCVSKHNSSKHDLTRGTIYPPNDDTVDFYKQDTFTSMKFKAPLATHLSADNKGKRPMSSFSVRVNDSIIGSNTDLKDKNDSYMASLSPPPAYYEPPAARTPSPRSTSPRLNRSNRVSPVGDMGGSEPPEGRKLYHGEYLSTPEPFEFTRPHLPAPSPTSSPAPSPYRSKVRVVDPLKKKPKAKSERDFIF